MSRVSSSHRQNPGAAARPFLDRIFELYHRADRIGRDPLHWAREYDNPADREIVAFLAAGFAYGAVAQIDRSLSDLFRRMGRSPATFVHEFFPRRGGHALEGFYHRLNDSADAAATIETLGLMLRGWGSIENFWIHANEACAGKGEDDDNKKASGVALKAKRFVDAALALSPASRFNPGASRGGEGRPDSFFHLWANPVGGGAAKRLFMFLRWVARPEDGVDLGLWSAVRPAELEYPVDTHIHRIATYLGATGRPNPDGAARREITDFFRAANPEDPVRYDFSLCRLGILRQCPRRQEVALCDACGLNPICQKRREMLSPGASRRG